MNRTFSKIGKLIAITSLIFIVLAFLPSIAPFTPAVLIAPIAIVGALVGALSGWVKTAVLTIYTAIATILVSPISLWVEKYIELGFLIISAVIFGCFLAAILLYIHIKQRKNIIR